MKKSKKKAGNSFIKIYSIFQKNRLIRKLKIIMYYFDRLLLIFVKKPKYFSGKKKKVLIIFNLAFGDGIVFLNSLTNLRSIYPKNKYEISIAVQNGLEKIYEKNNIFDRIISLDFNK